MQLHETSLCQNFLGKKVSFEHLCMALREQGKFLTELTSFFYFSTSSSFFSIFSSPPPPPPPLLLLLLFHLLLFFSFLLLLLLLLGDCCQNPSAYGFSSGDISSQKLRTTAPASSPPPHPQLWLLIFATTGRDLRGLTEGWGGGGGATEKGWPQATGQVSQLFVSPFIDFPFCRSESDSQISRMEPGHLLAWMYLSAFAPLPPPS